MTGTVLGLFSGIGGFELGFATAGFECIGVCENWHPARRVLQRRHPSVRLLDDVRNLPDDVPTADGIVAGFPCTNLSLAGDLTGLEGPASQLVDHALDQAARPGNKWVVLENVPNMLWLHGGAVVEHVTAALESGGYRWAYRVVDSRFTGVPQRRRRVVLYAARDDAPLPHHVLFADETEGRREFAVRDDAFGFYWTEGRWGAGLIPDAIPTLKGGSTIGINSAPAIYIPDAAIGRRFVIPSIEDGERLQGFYAGRTSVAVRNGERNHRWKLVGNAVTVGVARWIARNVANPKQMDPSLTQRSLDPCDRWPTAAYGSDGDRTAVTASEFPTLGTYRHLLDFVDLTRATRLSPRATRGFSSRVRASGRLSPLILKELALHERAS